MITVSRARIACLAMTAVVAVSFPNGPASGQSGRHILLIADRPSHGPLQHEHNATVHLLQKWLKHVPGVTATTSFDGWPADLTTVEKADAVFLFCTGGERHPTFQENRVDVLQKAAARGAGLMFYHYCIEPPAAKGRPEMLEWIGGYFEIHYSVNPVWDAGFEALPSHPITRGVKPFRLKDEWYYNMRFVPNMRGIIPILTAIPPADTLSRPDGSHSGNPDVRSKVGQPQTVFWAFEHPNGGRGVGVSGGHYHVNLGDEQYRKLLLNSLLWIAKVDVPPNGVDVKISPDELSERLDPKPQKK